MATTTTPTYTGLGTYNDAGLSGAAKAGVQAAQSAWAAANAAGDTTGMANAHAQAEAIRAANGVYSGGVDGTQYIPIGQEKTTGGSTGSSLGGLLNQLNPYGVSPTSPVANGLAVGDRYGLTYDTNTILQILNNATNASYAAQQQQQQEAQNNYYNNLYATQDATLDTIRKAQAQAVATGASKGISAANELSSILNLQNTTATQANDLANQSNNLAAQQQAALAKNAQSAVDTSNQVKEAIGNLDLTKYGYDVQHSAAILDYLANIAQTAGGIMDSQNTLAGVKYNADQNLSGTQYTADKNLAGTIYNADYGYGGSKNPSYAQASQPPVYNNYYGGSGGSYKSGSGYTGGSNSSGSTTGGSTAGTNASATANTAYNPNTVKLTYSGDTLTQNTDGSWILHTTDGNGNNINKSITAAEKQAIVTEGTPDVITKNGYVSNVMHMSVGDGTTVNIDGQTYKYSDQKHLWVNTKSGTLWGSKNLRSWQAKSNINHAGTAIGNYVSDNDATDNSSAFNTWKAKAESTANHVVVHRNGQWKVIWMADAPAP